MCYAVIAGKFLLLNMCATGNCLGTAVAQWLRCCATNRKVAGSIPAGVIDIKYFWSHYGPGVDSASNRNECQAAGAYVWQPYHHPVPLSCNLGTLTSWNPLGHTRPVSGLLYLYWWLLTIWHGTTSVHVKSLTLNCRSINSFVECESI